MAILGIGFLLLWVLAFVFGIFVTRWNMRWFLGPLGDAARANPKERVQYSIMDIYLLIGQIAVYSLPSSLAETPQTNRAANMLIVAAFNLICWALAMRLLARARISERLPRIILMLLYPWIVAAALFYGFSILQFILISFIVPFATFFWAGGFVIAMLIFRAVSRWVLSRSECPETLMSSAKYAGGYAAPVTTANTASAQNSDKFSSNTGMDDDLKLQ